MCGFAGWVGKSEPSRVSRRADELETALRLLDHRGPESSRSLISHGTSATAALGAVRLRIIDLRPEADMPMTLPNRSATLVYNGELYNTEELRSTLISRGHRFTGTSDTECILHLYEEHRETPEAMLPLLRGMFAFAIWDPTLSRLFAARDRVGIKPLWYMAGKDEIVFASEARALGRSGLALAGLDSKIACAYIRWGVVPGDRSILGGVKRLSAGCCLTWRDGETKVHTWWAPDFTPLHALEDPSVAVRAARAALSDSVARHLIADRPVGIFLSGGTDSLVVATLAASAGAPMALTLSFPDDPNLDETPAAAAAANRLGLSHETVGVSDAEIAGLVPSFLQSLDSPSMDGLNSWLVCRAARQAGLVVALSGLGADELVGGYPTFDLIPKVLRVAQAGAVLPDRVRARLARVAVTRKMGSRLGRILDAQPHMDDAYRAVRGLFSQYDLRNSPRAPDAPAFSSLPPHHHDAVTALEISHFLGHQLLPDTDSVSMSHSLEVRVPMIDDAVVATVLAIPAGTRAHLRKSLLLSAAEISETPRKRPFSLPMRRWLLGPLRHMLDEGLLSNTLPFADEISDADRRRLHDAFLRGQVEWTRPWSIVVLRLWPGLNGISA